MAQISSGPNFITGNTYTSLLRGNLTAYRMLGVPRGGFLLTSLNVGHLPEGLYVVHTELQTPPDLDRTTDPDTLATTQSAPPAIRVTYNNKDSSGVPGPSGGLVVTQDFNSFGQTIVADGVSDVVLLGVLDRINLFLADPDVAKVDFLNGGLGTQVYTVIRSSSSDTIPGANIEALRVVFSTWYGRSELVKV